MPINRARISGHVICDYIWCINTPLSQNDQEFYSKIENEPKWNQFTELLVTFNGSLLAGNITSGDSTVTSWRIYRQKDDDENLELAAIIDNNATSVTDYAICNKSNYTYSLFAEADTYITAPIVAPDVKTNWLGWTLFSVDGTAYPNEFSFREGFIFDLNFVAGQITNNVVVGKYDNFTQYPKIHKGRTNYYSGILSSLLAYTKCPAGTVENDPDMETRLKAFSTDTHRKFLRDQKGHLWEVEITAPIIIQSWNDNENYPYTVQVGWSEIGNAKDIIITNLPRMAYKTIGVKA